MANFDFKGLAKVLGIAAGTGVAVAGTYGLAKEAWNDYMMGNYGQAAFCALGAGSGACLAGLGVKAYTNITLPSPTAVVGISSELTDSINKVTEAAKSLSN